MQYSIVYYSEVLKNADFRFDAEYYHPRCLDIHNKIKKKSGTVFFEKIKAISSGKNLLQDISGKYKFIRTQNIRPILISDVGISYTSNIKNLNPIKEGELLFVRVGEGVGNSSVVTKQYSHQAISDNVLRIELQNINPYFASVFFNCQIGQNYFKRVVKGTARSLISQENFKDILIPTFTNDFQGTIQNLVEKSQELIKNSKSIYQEAEKILLAELGLINWKAKHRLWFVKNYSDTQETERIDAEYFQPKYDEIITAIKNYSGGFNLLEKFISNYSTGFPFKSSSYVENGCYLIRINNIEKGNLNIANAQKIPNKNKNLSKKDIAKENDILISMSGTIGNACKIPKSIEAVINQRIFRLTPKNFNEEILTLLINSVVGYSQLQRIGTGGIQTNISSTDIKKIKIPLIKKEVQTKIQQKVEESFRLRQQSKHLLECAKKTVDIAIEKDEHIATQWLEKEISQSN